MAIKTYTELQRLNSFEERFNYLKLDGSVGIETFGFDRYLNQVFYKSKEWKSVRDYVILRDHGCDLGVDGFEIRGRVLVHHMNPISIEDIYEKKDNILDPEFLICTSHDTHNAIHYSNEEMLPRTVIARQPGDTCLWKKGVV